MFLKRLYEPLERAIDESILEVPTDIQKEYIPQIKSGRDVVCFDEEDGNGKTTALVIATIHKLKEEYADVPRAMILVPDEEKGKEMEELFATYGDYTSLRVHTAYPTRKLDDQRDSIYFGTDILIGTVSQINTQYSMSGINLGNLQMLIIDDADLIIKDASVGQMNRIFECVPKCQKIMFTKKVTDNIQRLIDNEFNVF